MNKGGQAGRLEREGTYKSSRELTVSGERFLYALAQEGIVGCYLKIVNYSAPI